MERQRMEDIVLPPGVVVRTLKLWQTTRKNNTDKRAARAARLFFPIQPLKSFICQLICGVA